MTSVVYLSRNLKNGKIWAGTSNRILAKVLGGHQKRVKFAFFNFSFKRTNQITGTLTAVSFAFLFQCPGRLAMGFSLSRLPYICAATA